ncbi:OmpA family protein [Aurantivibrio infirmus]
MKLQNRFKQVFLIGSLSLIACSSVFADEMRDSLFKQVDLALKSANEARASVLAPKSYEEAAILYRKAEDRLKKGQSIDRIRKDLEEAVEHFNTAADATRLAEVTFTTTIQARNDAEAAQAETYASELWENAEKSFEIAARRLEAGNVNRARKESQEAETQYRSAELQAIKINYLSETTKLISNAKQNRVDRYAPLTLSKAESLLAEAERELVENRYDTDRPRLLAKQARYEAKHAIYIADAVKPLREKDQSPEEFILSAEIPVAEIASGLDLVAEFDTGMEQPTKQIRDQIAVLRTESAELFERKNDILSLEAEIQQLEARLGVQSERLANQEEYRRRFTAIENLFTSDEAIVLSQGGNVVIRTIGLNFDPGSSQIGTQYFSLLKKVQEALQQFPNSAVVVEGHTDSFGGDEANLNLSVARAEAVREYLLANMSDRSTANIEAVGYGETKPIGNNETVEGRTKNRRIDLVLKSTLR